MLLRSAVAAFLFMCLAVPGFSQQPAAGAHSSMPDHPRRPMSMWGMTSQQDMDHALDTLQRTLNLSQSQAESIRRLSQTRRESLQTIREQARPKVRELMTLLREQNPDPASVGRIMIDLKSMLEQAREKQAYFERQLSTILNPDQQQIVNNLRNQAQTLAALRTLGLLGGREFPHGPFMGSLDSDAGSHASDAGE